MSCRRRMLVGRWPGRRDGGELTPTLLSCKQSYGDEEARVAAFIDKILRGASPADLPFEVPVGLLLRATRVIG